MATRWLAVFGLLLLVLAAAFYWLLPAYVLPPMAVSQRPAQQVELVPAAAPVTSYVSIPLALSVDKIKRLVREQLSGKLLADNISVPGRDLKVSVQRNGQMALWIRDADMHMVLPLRFRTEGDLSTKGELTIFTRASFNVSEDWEPVVDARSTFRWDWQPRVGVWPFRFRIGKILAPHVQLALDKGSEDFRTQAASLYNLRAIAEGGWERLHGPHLLNPEKQAWFVVQPRELYLEPITSDGTEVRLNVWMGGELGMTGEKPQDSPAPAPLPKLRHGAPPAKTIVLAAPLTIYYEHMLGSLREALLNQTLPSSAGELTLVDLELYGAGRDVVLGLQFRGQRHGALLPSRGWVYLTGQPGYDPATRTLSIRQLQLTESGNNPLAHGSRWVLEQAPSWVADLQQRMSWDASLMLDEHRKQLGADFNRTVHGRFDLWGDIAELRVTGAVPHTQGVMLQAQATGKLELLFVP